MGLALRLWSQFCSCLLCLLVTIPLRDPLFKPSMQRQQGIHRVSCGPLSTWLGAKTSRTRVMEKSC
jgi:hypothetical protein